MPAMRFDIIMMSAWCWHGPNQPTIESSSRLLVLTVIGAFAPAMFLPERMMSSRGCWHPPCWHQHPLLARCMSCKYSIKAFLLVAGSLHHNANGWANCACENDWIPCDVLVGHPFSSRGAGFCCELLRSEVRALTRSRINTGSEDVKSQSV